MVNPSRDTLISIILFVVGITYANAVFGEFIFDDYSLIIDNPYIKNLKFFPLILTSGFVRLDPTGINYYRPLQEISYALDYFLWKENKIGYHITNLWFHFAAAVVLFFLTEYFFKSSLLAFFSTLFFGIHPLYTSGVTYLSGRADSMVIFFILMSVFLLVKNIGSPQKEWRKNLFISCLFFILSLLTKEAAVFLILIIAGLMFYPRNDFVIPAGRKIQAITAFCVAGLVCAGWRYYVLKTIFVPQYNIAGQVSIPLRVFTAIKALGVYLGLLVFPLNLHLERTISPARSIREPEVLLPIFVLIMMLCIMFKLRHTKGPVFFGLFWFFIWFLPVSNVIIPLNAFLAENWIQLPALGIFLAAGFFLEKWLRGEFQGRFFKKIKKAAIPFFVMMVVYYSLLTISRNRQYAEPVVFYKHALLFEPQNARLYNNLGLEYQRRNNKEGAAAMYTKALEVDPNHAASLNNLANIFSSQGRHEEAINLYRRILVFNPKDTLCLSNLGVAYIRKGDREKALSCWRKSLKLNPNQPAIREYIDWNR